MEQQPTEWLNHTIRSSFTSFHTEYAEQLFTIYNQLFKEYHTTITFEQFLTFSFLVSDYKCRIIH